MAQSPLTAYYLFNTHDVHGIWRTFHFTRDQAINGRDFDMWDAAYRFCGMLNDQHGWQMSVSSVMREGAKLSLTGGNARANGFTWNRED